MPDRMVSHYRILRQVGRGGMGVVYKAEDTRLERLVALKFLHPDVIPGEKEKKRFRNEAQAAASLDHPNICTVYEMDEFEGQAFIAMAYVEGESLRKTLEAGPLPVDKVIDIAMQTCRGLHAAHDKGVIHRDIKSANLLMTSEGRVKITDFGLARLSGRTKITKPGTTMGTVAYMSPEQIRAEEVDGRSDIFSLGVVMYESLTGHLPFEAEHDAAVTYRILNDSFDPIAKYRSDVPRELGLIIEKALEKERNKRYRSADEMLTDLKRLAVKLGLSSSAHLGGFSFRRRAAAKQLWKILLPVGIALLLVMLMPSDWKSLKRWGIHTGLPREKHLLILPFENIGGDPTSKVLCDGLVETMTSSLTRLEQFHGSLWIVPASEVRETAVKSAGEARRLFGVNLVVTGSVQYFEDRFQITLNLVDAENLRQINSTIIDNPRKNISILQEAAVMDVARMLELEVGSRSREVLAAGSTMIPGAYEFYLQGRGYLRRYEDIGSIDAAIGLFERAATADSLYALAYAALGEAFWRKYELTGDTELIDRAQSNCRKALGISDLLAPVRVTLGIIYRGTGRYDLALAEFKRAIQFDPRDYDAYLEMAIAYADSGMSEQAEVTYEKAIELRPAYWAAYSHLGELYWRRGDLENAERMFRRVVELTPDNIRGYNNLIGIYFLIGKGDQAEEMYRKSIAVKPNPVAYSNMGTIYIYTGRYKDAIPMLEKAIDLGASHYSMYGNLADSYRYTPGYEEKSRETYSKAIELAKEQLDVNPKNSSLRSSIALFYAKSGERERALREIERATAQTPDDATIIYKSSIVYELAGKREEALRAIERALKLGLSEAELRSEPELSELREDDRYKKLIQN